MRYVHQGRTLLFLIVSGFIWFGCYQSHERVAVGLPAVDASLVEDSSIQHDAAVGQWPPCRTAGRGGSCGWSGWDGTTVDGEETEGCMCEVRCRWNERVLPCPPADGIDSICSDALTDGIRTGNCYFPCTSDADCPRMMLCFRPRAEFTSAGITESFCAYRD